MDKKTAVILVNVGTPNSPDVKDVRKYLSEFLNDFRVIDLPWLLQKILVNLIIVPFRAPKSAKLYKMLWTDEGSPLVSYGQKLVDKLNPMFNDDTHFYLAMRYQHPALDEILRKIKHDNYGRIIVLPLFPQYASSTTGTILEKIYKSFANDILIPEIIGINQFYQHPAFIKVFADRIRSYNPEKYDHIVFSYHGLPVRHVNKIHPSVKYHSCSCATEMPEHGQFCYKATCYETTRLIAKELQLPTSAYSVSFQSRLTKNWLKPFTDKSLVEIAKSGKKKILVTAPAFVTDCLETIVEIGFEYQQLFTQHGGTELKMVESLNDQDSWAKVVQDIIVSYSPESITI